MNPLTRPLIYLVALNLLPSVWLRPFWITAFGFALVGYRLWLAQSARPMPPWWLRVPVQIAIASAVWAQYHTVLGDESAGALLTLLTCLKLYELRTPRDHFIGYLLCLLVLMSHLLLDTSLPITLFLIGDGVLLTAYLYALGSGRLDLSGFAFGATLRAVAKAAPLVVVTFVLFPRFTTGFGSGDDGGARTGVTDRLRPGSISSLVGSNELAFRAQFSAPSLPARATLYWRGAVLDESDGLNWGRGKAPPREAPAIPNGPTAIEITLEPGNDRFLYTTAEAGQIAFPNEDVGRAVIRRGAGTYELGANLRGRERYELHEGRAAGDDRPDAYLAVKQAPTARMTEFLEAHRGSNDGATVHEMMQVFRADYTYTLLPPHVRTIDDFMFGTRTGFCEHYAGALATMLRFQHIPSRVVLGFQGGTPSWLERFVTVRAHDAHAWVEWYDRQASTWRRLDPTSQLDPRRIAEGAEVYLARAQGGADLLNVFARARAAFDDVDAAWTGFLLRFDRNEQRRLMSKLGLGGERAWLLPVLLIAAVAFILLLINLLDRRGRRRRSEADRLYEELARRAARVTGLTMEPHETLAHFARRSGHAQLGLVTAQALPLIYGAGPHPISAWDDIRRRLRALHPEPRPTGTP